MGSIYGLGTAAAAFCLIRRHCMKAYTFWARRLGLCRRTLLHRGAALLAPIDWPIRGLAGASMASGSALQGFKIIRVLDSDDKTKSISVVGSFDGLDSQAVIAMRRRPFDEATLPAILSGNTTTELHFRNDIYSQYTGTMPAQLNQINIDITHPATEKHIGKAEAQDYMMVSETAEDYQNITLPFIQSIPPSRISWVYNILTKTAEADRLIFEDPDAEVGFVLHPDMKWDQQRLENLYCIAIVHRRDIRSLRDLRSEHVPLLHNVYSKGTEALKQKYEVRENLLRVYVHYQPSYYHLHVHFVHIKQDLGPGMAAGKAHLLLDIIDTLRVAPNFYKERTLHYILGAKDPLLSAFRAAEAPIFEMQERGGV